MQLIKRSVITLHYIFIFTSSNINFYLCNEYKENIIICIRDYILIDISIDIITSIEPNEIYRMNIPYSHFFSTLQRDI